jgi:putative glutamine amidotransferase
MILGVILIMKPIIGIVPLWDSNKKSYWMLPGYVESIIDSEAIPVILPMTDNTDIIDRLFNTCGGILFTGGQDISPSIYGEAAFSECGEICGERDNMEKYLFELVLKNDKPALGICRGIQIFNALLGGTLYQDLNSQFLSNINHHQLPPYNLTTHKVKLCNQTPLQALLKKDVLEVNSYHHQAIRTLSEELSPMAFSEDGLTEAVYMPSKRFVWAVQWHPEFLYKTDENSRKIFRAFINSAS